MLATCFSGFDPPLMAQGSARFVSGGRGQLTRWDAPLREVQSRQPKRRPRTRAGAGRARTRLRLTRAKSANPCAPFLAMPRLRTLRQPNGISRFGTCARPSPAPAEAAVARTLTLREIAPRFRFLLHRPEHARGLPQRASWPRSRKPCRRRPPHRPRGSGDPAPWRRAPCPSSRPPWHQPAVGIDADMSLHAEIPLVSLLRLRHLGVAPALLVLAEGDAAISVASTMVPPRSSSPLTARRSDTAAQIAFVRSCRSSWWPTLQDRRVLENVALYDAMSVHSVRPTSTSSACRRALPPRPHQTECTTAAGNRCAA